ncbi:hypothetical protein [Cryptosporangium sp. NPDC048952]|uniref:hypothetical protein n=1 Tax=Cryptosporangium sp. NPDC048952 TaxID=3363961 RepID=UPI0037231697
MSARIAGGAAILLALVGLFTGSWLGKGHEHAALIYVGALLLVAAGVFGFARPSRTVVWLLTALAVAYVVLMATIFALNRP